MKKKKPTAMCWDPGPGLRKRLIKGKNESGIPMSEIIRRAVDKFLKEIGV